MFEVRVKCFELYTRYISYKETKFNLEPPNKIIFCELIAVENTELLKDDISIYRQRQKIFFAAPTYLYTN